MRRATLTETLRALAHLGNDYHSGQWSRGYRLLCLTNRALWRRGEQRPIDRPLRPVERGVYRTLLARYGNTL